MNPSARSQPWLDEAGESVAVVVVRHGRLPVGAAAAAAEAGGTAVVVGSEAESGARALLGARLALWADTGPGLQVARLADALAAALEPVPLVVLPSSPDGRDLAPRLAAALGRRLLAGAIEARCCRPGGGRGARAGAGGGPVSVRATLSRLDDRVLVPVEVDGSAVVTLLPAPGTAGPTGPDPRVEPLPRPAEAAEVEARRAPPDVEMLAEEEPDVRTMDLADATRVMAGGAGLAAGVDDHRARSRFELLERVAATIGASAGATRVATDAGWAPHERQVGTTGVTISPDLYVAFGISGATQHIGGLGSPRHVISVNTDGACPMTSMADLGLVTDAPALLAELAERLDRAATADQPTTGASGDG